MIPALTFSTKSQIWGDVPETIEPAYITEKLRQEVLAKDGYCCMFCGFSSRQNQVHNLNDNHHDICLNNLRAVDPLCHGWQHLGELGDGNAIIAYLPGLSGQDVNHLQRTITVALQSDDADVREDAKKLMGWLASHCSYTKDAWGTNDPAVFASALIRLEEKDRDNRTIVFQGLTVIFNPTFYDQDAATWVRESYDEVLPTSKWGQVFHNVMNAPT